jgi:hypothetical protein
VKKTKQVGKVDPKPAIQTAGIESSIHQRIVALDHHEPLTSQTMHERIYLYIQDLLESFHHQRHATRQQSSTENRGHKREVCAGPAAGHRSVEQLSHPALHHQHEKSEQRTNDKPPSKGSHNILEPELQKAARGRPSVTLAEGRWAVKKTDF